MKGQLINGISKVFTAQKNVNIDDQVRIKFAICDVGDFFVNSYIFIKGDSLTFEPDTPPEDPEPDPTLYRHRWRKILWRMGYRHHEAAVLGNNERINHSLSASS